MAFPSPLVYPILDASFLPAAGRGDHLDRLGRSLAEAGVTLLEYRNKTGPEAELVSDARILRAAMASPGVRLILDDRADLVDSVDFDGVHVDEGDLPPAEARRLLGPRRIVGTFGGGERLLAGILAAPVDYLAIGPVYPTTTKVTVRAPIGTGGVARLRREAGPEAVLVAAAGITLDRAAAVLEAGATTVAVAAAIFRAPDPAAEFRRWARELK